MDTDQTNENDDTDQTNENDDTDQTNENDIIKCIEENITPFSANELIKQLAELMSDSLSLNFVHRHVCLINKFFEVSQEKIVSFLNQLQY